MTTNVNIIRLPEEQDESNDAYNDRCPNDWEKNFIVSGWGYDSLKRKPNVLLRVLQKCLASSRCGYEEGDDKSPMLCAGDLQTTSNSACKGDSGGKNIAVFLSKHIKHFT